VYWENGTHVAVVHDLERFQEAFGRHPAVEEVAEEELFLVVLSDVEIKCAC
jgi:hypothetical protein